MNIVHVQCWNCRARGSNHQPWHRDAWVLRVQRKSRLVDQSSNYSSPPYTHPATYPPPSQISARPRAAFNTLVGWIIHFPAYLMHVLQQPGIGYKPRISYTRARQARRTDIGRHYNSVGTAEPGDQTTNPGIVMPECYASGRRVDSLTRVVITPVCHTHTRLHTHTESLLNNTWWCTVWWTNSATFTQF